MVGGYKEWIHESRIAFITNSFGRVLYMMREWPDGDWEKFRAVQNNKLTQDVKKKCKAGRTFNKEELMLELL